MSNPSTDSTSRTQNPSEDSNSVYFLGSHDFTGTAVVGDILTGENYISWTQGVEMALNIKNKIAFIDCSLPLPTEDGQIVKTSWIRADNFVRSWLLNSVSKEIRHSILRLLLKFGKS